MKRFYGFVGCCLPAARLDSGEGVQAQETTDLARPEIFTRAREDLYPSPSVQSEPQHTPPVSLSEEQAFLARDKSLVVR